jgi:hypothetical protein
MAYKRLGTAALDPTAYLLGVGDVIDPGKQPGHTDDEGEVPDG